VLLGTAGAAGLAYVGIVTVRASRPTGYKPVFEDWLWHNVLPLISYALLLGGGILMSGNALTPFFMIGAASLVLLFCGIHNSWDTVTFIVMQQKKTEAPGDAGSSNT